MGRWNHTLLAVGSSLMLTSSIVQPVYASSSIASADKPIYMMYSGTKTLTANNVNITLVRQKDGSLHLCNEDGKHESMPDASPSMTKSRTTTDFQASIRWDEKKQKFTIKRNDVSAAIKSSGYSSSINNRSKRILLDELRLGGIGIGDSLDYVKSIYGEPTKIGKKGKNYLYDGLYGYEITYGDSFKLDVIDENDGREIIINVVSTANNGLALSNGIKVGSTAGDIFKNFGMPWRTNNDKDGNKSYVYRSIESPKIMFETDKMHVITKIYIIGME